jgi:Holliday junction DNA helicase RuvB
MVGQTRLLWRLQTHLEAAIARGSQPGHIMLDGGPGLGKTTIAKGVAGELCAAGVESRFHEITADAISNPRKLAVELSKLSTGDVLFVDEIQAMKTSVQCALLRVMEDGIMFVEGNNKSPAIRFEVPAFTLIAATTHPGKLSQPLRDRFKFVGHLEPYDFDDLQLVLLTYAERSGMKLDDDAAEIIAGASRYTPRIAIKLLGGVRDYAFTVTKDIDAPIDVETAKQGLEFAGVDTYGLEERDRRVMTVMLQDFDGGPIGLTPLASTLGMDITELTRDVEPYLVRAGLWSLMPGGRGATKATWIVITGDSPAMINGRR